MSASLESARGRPEGRHAPKRPVAGAAAAPLMHWLTLVVGLAILTVTRVDELDRVVPLWVGGALGTLAGQVLAARRLRLWLSAFVIGNLAWVGPLMMLPLWVLLRDITHPWAAVEVSIAAFIPAALCGYFSLTERGALLAIWFPATLWTLAILDRSGGPAIHTEGAWLLLSGLAALFLATLHTREARRVALWQAHGTAPLAEVRRRVVLREAPLRPAARAGWLAATGAIVLFFTAWVAPNLWQHDELDGRAPAANAAAQNAESAAGGDGAVTTQTEPCCPDEAADAVPRRRVREYFPLARPQDDDPRKLPATHCVACRDGVAVGSSLYGQGHGVAVTAPVGTVTPHPQGWPSHVTVAPEDPPAVPIVVHPQETATPEVEEIAPQASSAPVVAAKPATQAPREPPRTSPARAAVAVGPAPGVHAAKPPPPAKPRVAASRTADPPYRSLLAFAIVALGLHLALRPVRRVLTIRHLQRPLWPETVDQRVSNLWELMLVGLRDAGFRAVPGEQPQDLCRRVGLEGMSTCASVLDRARHGVRVDAADLAAMTRAARAVYEAARRRAGWAARAASWMRGPLS